MTVHRNGKTWLTKLDKKLDANKAKGIDGMSKNEYGKELETNITSLLKRIRTDQYRPKPAKVVKIPKEDGSHRPLAISCLEDKIVQSAVGKILESIYEPIFLSYSYGFRSNKSAHEALSLKNDNASLQAIDL